MPYQPTSRAAFSTANLPRREAQVYCALRDHASGLIDPEICQRTGLPVNVVTGARNALVDRGLVADSGRTRVNPASGKRGIVWILREPDMPQQEPAQTSLF